MPSTNRKPRMHVGNAVLQKVMKEAPNFLFDSSYTWVLGLILWNFEIIMNLFIISKVKYTNIDWDAYMGEVGGFLNGTRDYLELEGNTGPLVYPAGFVYIYSALYYATNHGINVRLAQYIFFLFYLANLYFVIRIYHKTQKCPPYVLIFMSFTSYRVHSIFVLRLFNDPVAMLIFFVSLNFMLDKKWFLGSFFFSLAVSVKMNILLFAPGLLVVLLIENGIYKTVQNLSICAIVQVILAAPFLNANPTGYLTRSFDLSRQFMHVWTVNWRFLSPELFSDRRLHLALLASHFIVLFAFAGWKWRKNISELFSLINFKQRWNKGIDSLSANQITTVLFTSNFIGMCFSRSLHYQFYVWYYHTIPYLLWSTNYSSALRLLLFGLIELCWNTYPSTEYSSLCLHACHITILVGLWRNKDLTTPNTVAKDK